MAINLAKKFESSILTKWQAESFIAGKVNSKYDFAGVRSITIYTPQTVDLQDYTRTGATRFGTSTEIQDTIQELYLNQDKAFSLTIDKGNNSDQMMIKGAGEMLALQMKEKMVPHIDKYCLLKWVQYAGNAVAVTAPAVGNIVASLSAGLTKLDNEMVPDDGRLIFIGATNYDYLRRSTEVFNTPSLSAQVIGRGVVGQFMNATLVKVPDVYLPLGVAFVIIHKDAVIYPLKLKTLRILTDVAGIDGAVLEGRHYFDAFVLGQKSAGVYVGHVSATLAKYPTPTTAYAGSGATLTITNASLPTGSTIYYTTDGSDPRYIGPTVKTTTSLTGVNPAIGEQAKCYFRATTEWLTATNQTIPANFSLPSDVLTFAVRAS